MKKIQSNIDESILLMHKNVGNLMKRGYQLDELEMNSEALLESSNQFVYETVPWYNRITNICPSWWFFWNHQTSASQEQPFFREITTSI
jgi:hypothetical protein